MHAALVLAAVAAVLAPSEVVLIRAESAAVLGRVPLPEAGVAIFAAPDGAAIVPLLASDATAIVRADGQLRVEPGRWFPLFFDEFDRMYVVLSGSLALLAYPQRVRIAETPLPGIAKVRHAVVSANGLAVALVGSASEAPGVWVVTTGGEARVIPVSASCDAERVALAPNGDWLAVSCAGGYVALAGVAGVRTETISLGGEIAAMKVDELGRDLVVALSSTEQRGALVRLRLRPGGSSPIRERSRLPLPRPPRALALHRSLVLVLDDRAVSVWEQGGRRLAGEIPLAAGIDLVMLRESVGAMPTSWGESVPR